MSNENEMTDGSGSPPDGIGSTPRVAIVGAGTMGHGIAVAFAAGDCPVALYDADETALRSARERVQKAASTLAEHDATDLEDADSVLEAVEYDPSLPSAVADADVVVEAVTEDLDAKKDVFRKVERHAPRDALFASNTSSLSITEIGSAVEEPARLLGTHWFHPPHVVPVVEVVKGEATADESIRDVADLLERIGKRPVVVEKDIPGFIANRIQSAMAHEAWSLLHAGVASAEDIDAAVKGTFGFRLPALGVFEKADNSGLDVHAEVLRQLLGEIDRGTTPSPALLELVEEGRVGKKAGAGVYEWSEVDAERDNEARDRQLLSLLEVYRQRERPAPPRRDGQ